MEAPFRFPIESFADVERLFNVLVRSPHVAAGSREMTEGAEMLMQQLMDEKRGDDAALVRCDCIHLLRVLWGNPLQAQRPRFLRFNAKLATDPAIMLSIRIDVPTRDSIPRWIDAEGNRNPTIQKKLIAVYRAIADEAALKFVIV